MKNGVRSDNQKNNKTALPRCDFFSVFLRYAVLYFVHEGNDEASKFRNKIIEAFLRMPGLSRKTRLIFRE